MNGLKWSEQKERLFWDVCFLTVYAVLLAKTLAETSQLRFVFEQFAERRNSYYLWIRLLAATVVLAKAVRTERYDLKELLISGFILIAFWRCFQVAGYEELIDLAIVVFGARKVSFQKILAVHAAVSALLIIGLVAASQAGRVEDWIFYRYREGEQIAKHSYGFLYPNEFGAHVFFLLLGWSCLRREKITFAELAVMVLCAVLLERYCYSRTNFACIMLLAAGLLIWKLIARVPQVYRRKAVKVTGVLLALVPLFCCALMIALALLYREDQALLVKLNGWLNGRLSISKAGFNNYGVKLFGQPIVMYGMALETNWAEYNFLDCSYIMLLIRCGIAPFFSVWLLIAMINIRAYRNRDLVLLFVMALCGVQCMMEHHLYDIAYNPLLLAAFAALPDMLQRGEKEGAERHLCTEEQVKDG